jgi:C4-type Zn-finger protein
MGTMITIECQNCHYIKPFQLGIGFAFSPHRLLDVNSEDSLLHSLIRSKKTFAYVKSLILEHHGDFVEYGLKLFHCPKCSEFYSRFDYQIIHDDGIFASKYKCTKCKHKLEIVPKMGEQEWQDCIFDLSSYTCPECGEKTITYYESGLWD